MGGAGGGEDGCEGSREGRRRLGKLSAIVVVVFVFVLVFVFVFVVSAAVVMVVE